jgi:hypothetical protein
VSEEVWAAWLQERERALEVEVNVEDDKELLTVERAGGIAQTGNMNVGNP